MKSGLAARTVIWGLLLGGLGGALCLVPLFDLLGFEHCFALGVAAGFAGAHLSAATVWDRRVRAARSDGERADARPLAQVLRWWLSASVRTWALLLLPLALVSLNALRVRNCNYAAGLAWFAALPVFSAAMGTAAGVCAGLLGDFRRRVVPTVIAFTVVIASLLWAGWRFYSAPPIFAYDPFGGYFPGTLYDEEVTLRAPLYWARLYHLAGAATALFACSVLLDGRRIRLRLSAARGRGGIALLATLAAVLALSLHARGASLGFLLDARDVARALGAEKKTDHFVLHYAASGPWAKDLTLHTADFELRHRQLETLLGVTPTAPVHAYLFDSPAQKQSLMGAGHTFIAKPWRREIYLQADGWPHPVMMHELAHVFAGRFGDPIFGVSRRGLAFNVGLIEGVAVAAAWSGNPLTPHQLVKVMRDHKIEPPLSGVLSLRFFGWNPSQAYNVAGSFCRFLLEKYGAAPLRQVFHQAGTPASWSAAYGRPLSALQSEWSAFIDTVEVPAADALVMHERLRRPGVFHKVCAHELALRREAAHRALGEGDRARALAALETVCHDDPDEPANLIEIMDASTDDPTAAARAIERVLAHPKLSAPLRARALSLRGDLALRAGDLAAADRAYAEAEALPLDEGTARLITVKRLSTHEPPGPVTDDLRRFLSAPSAGRDPALDLLAISQLVQSAPSRLLFHYLLGRQLESRARASAAIAELSAGLQSPPPTDPTDLVGGTGAPRGLSGAGLPDARFVREALRLLGRSQLRAGDLLGCRATFERLRAPQVPEGARIEAGDYVARCTP